MKHKVGILLIKGLVCPNPSIATRRFKLCA